MPAQKKRPTAQDISAYFTPPPKRQALADISPNVVAQSPVPQSPVTVPVSATMRELRDVQPSVARDTLERLVHGYTDKSGAGYPAALTNDRGCVLAQKGANRKDNGYIQITPISSRTRAGTVNGTVATKALPQGAHRLVVIAHGTDDDRHHLLYDGWQASHRCHDPTCVAPDHIACEPKDANEGRKDCARELWVLKTRVGGTEVEVRSKFKCQCEPKCIPRVLVAEE